MEWSGKTAKKREKEEGEGRKKDPLLQTNTNISKYGYLVRFSPILLSLSLPAAAPKSPPPYKSTNWHPSV